MLRVAINGATGRMGQILVKLVSRNSELEVAAALEKQGHPMIGIDPGPTAGVGCTGVKIESELTGDIDVMIDFTNPAGTIDRLPACIEGGIPIVIGTTGFDERQWSQLEAASEKIAMLVAPNMSVGVNLVFDVAADIARRLGKDCDIEIIEAHHNQKKDSPSGTAIAIAERIAEALDIDLNGQAIYGRHGAIGARPAGEIGIHAVRGGDIVGDHTVVFACRGERIELKHQAHSRANFAQGAVRAAGFLAGKPPGNYTMKDVLALQ